MRATPGPWLFVQRHDDDNGGFYSGEECVMHFGCENGPYDQGCGIPPSDADARLIAAAPEQQAKIDTLADALEAIIGEHAQGCVCADCCIAEAALRLAGRLP